MDDVNSPPAMPENVLPPPGGSLVEKFSETFIAQGPDKVWESIPEGLRNAAQSPKEGRGGDEGLKMAGQFAKVTTMNPLVHEFLDKRVIRLTGPITDEVATAVTAMMQLLNDIAPDQDIELRINSPGGSVTAGLAIYDAMKNLNCDVKTVCEGECASMAAVLLACGTPGKRFAMPSSTIMVHSISLSKFAGTVHDMKIEMSEVNRLETVLEDLLEQYTGLPEDKIKELMNRDHFMSAEDAKSFHLIDSVITPKHAPPFPKKSPAPTLTH